MEKTAAGFFIRQWQIASLIVLIDIRMLVYNKKDSVQRGKEIL